MRALTPVDSRKISVVIQGPLFRTLSPERNIFACIASVKKHLPDAEIIVSTWKHEDISQVYADQIIVLDDPGCLLDDAGNQINTNRMLLSTLAGVQASKRPYVMKLRADHNLTSAALAVIGKPEATGSDDTKLFATPITLTTLYLRNPERMPMLFHVSDLVQFGTREAMIALWNQPLLNREDIFNSRPSRNPFGNFTGFSSVRLVAEQSVMLGALRKQGINVNLRYPCDVRMGNLKVWDCVLRCNFRVLDYHEAGVDFPERFLTTGFALATLYTSKEVDQLSELSLSEYKLRTVRIWLNQYVWSCLRPAWWISLAAIVLFSASPAFGKAVRSQWRKLRKVTHADSYRT